MSKESPSFAPPWFHPKGKKGHRGEESILIDVKKRTLVIVQGKSAKLKIGALNPHTKNTTWQIEWDIKKKVDVATTIFDTKTLLFAFGINGAPMGENDINFLKNKEGDRAIKGKFFAYGNFLNIPLPEGSGNISLEIDPIIQEAVKKLVGLIC